MVTRTSRVVTRAALMKPVHRRQRYQGKGRWHPLHEHVAERLQPILRSLPGVVVTSVPFHLAD